MATLYSEALGQPAGNETRASPRWTTPFQHTQGQTYCMDPLLWPQLTFLWQQLTVPLEASSATPYPGLIRNPRHVCLHMRRSALVLQESGPLSDWEAAVAGALGRRYVRVAAESLMSIAILVYALKPLAPHITQAGPCLGIMYRYDISFRHVMFASQQAGCSHALKPLAPRITLAGVRINEQSSGRVEVAQSGSC